MRSNFGLVQLGIIPNGMAIVVNRDDIRNKPKSNILVGLGDSITMLSGASGSSVLHHSVYINAGYMGWCWILPKSGESVSEGKFSVGGVYGLTAQYIADIKNTYLPQVLAADPRPGICVVLAGTNNLLGIFNNPANLTSAIADITSIYNQLLSAKILPIACGVPTIGLDGTLANERSVIPTLNTAIESVATSLKIPYIDFFPLTDDGAGWKVGYCGNPGAGDNHPSNIGAKVMGQALRDYLDNYAVKFTAPNLVIAGNDASADLFWQNGTMVDDTDADKIPDGGFVQSANGWYIPWNHDATLDLITEAGVVSGKWWRLNKTGKTEQTIFKFASRVTQIAAGDRIGIGFMIKILNPEETGVTTFSVVDQSGNVIAEYNISHLLASVAPFKFYHELIVPVSVTNGLGFEFAINETGTMDFYIGQLTIRKL